MNFFSKKIRYDKSVSVGLKFMNISHSRSISEGVRLKGKVYVKYTMYLEKSTFIKQFKHFFPTI